jgi:alkylation response protein AidB-like acyl-CoA dehydrogenase
MDFSFTQEELDLRQEIEEFVRDALPPDWNETVVYWPGSYGTMPQTETEFQEITKRFNRMLGKKGWLSLGWPKEHGGQGSAVKAAVAGDILSYYRVPAGSIGAGIVGPTLILVGNEELKKEFLPPIRSGEIGFWLAYSEPNAGSDLVSLKTTGVDDGDDFIVNGQKIWSTGAHVSEYGWAIVKTDMDAPAHKSATLMIIPNDTPGVTINPIINICGNHSFNEVFFDDVRVPKKYVVGDVNKGFYYVMLALQFERMMIGAGSFRRVLEELVQYAKETVRNGRPLAEDSRVRKSLAAIAVELEVFLSLYWKSAWMQDRGEVPELEASALKLLFTELSVKLANAAVDLLGPYGLLDRGSEWAPFGGRIGMGYLDSISGPIGAGTSEIQKTILATRGLGLPRGR